MKYGPFKLSYDDCISIIDHCEKYNLIIYQQKIIYCSAECYKCNNFMQKICTNTKNNFSNSNHYELYIRCKEYVKEKLLEEIEKI